MLAQVYRGRWGAREALGSLLMAETRAIFARAVDEGLRQGPRRGGRPGALRESLMASADVFAAFRVHGQGAALAAEIAAPGGGRRAFAEWAARVQGRLNHQNRAWLQTEYATAVRRAHDEADWARFEADADLYPNLEWVPSTSAEPGADHRPLWGTVLPLRDGFWARHRPGDRWNCKCSLRQTAAPPTAAPSADAAPPPQPGLSAAPGSGRLFSDDHAYFPADCRLCPLLGPGGRLRALVAGALAAPGRGPRRTVAASCGECRAARRAIEGAGRGSGAQIVSDVAIRGFSQRPPVVVGVVEPQVRMFMEGRSAKMPDDGIVLTPKTVAHAMRRTKVDRGAAPAADEMADIEMLLRRAEVYYDSSHNNLLYVARAGDRLLKFVVQPGYRLKKMGAVNAVITAGVIKEEDLASGLYMRITK